MKVNTAQSTGRWRRISIKALGMVAGLAILFVITAPYLLGWIIGHELRTQLSTRINARLDFKRVLYEWPCGVLIDKAHLLMPATDGGVDSWIDVRRLELTLAKLPVGTGPLVIEKLVIDHPVVHLASSVSAESSAPAPPAASSPTQKLSDLFQLQKASITGGTFEYDFSQANHPIAPIVWGNLNLDMNTQAAGGASSGSSGTPTGPGLYQFAISIVDEPVVTADASGSFDIDSLQLNADKITMTVTCDPEQPSPQIPAQGFAFIRKYQVAGQLTIQGSGQMPFNSPGDAAFTARADLTNGSCKPPGFAAPITPNVFSIRADKQAGPCRFSVSLEDEDLMHGTATGTVDLTTLLMDLQKFSLKVHCDPAHPIRQLPSALVDSTCKIKTGGTIQLDGLARLPLLTPTQGWYAARASLVDGQCQPVGWSGPIKPASFLILAGNVPDSVSGNQAGAVPDPLPLKLPDRPAPPHLLFQGLNAVCGNQVVRIDGGEIALNPADNSWTARKFHGLVDIGDGPGPMEGANTRVYMPFILSGNGKSWDAGSSIRLALDDASASITPNHIHLNRINGMLTATPTGLRSSGLVAKCANGQIKATVNLDWQQSLMQKAEPVALAYDGDCQIQKLDLHQLAIQYTADPSVRQQAFGQFDFDAKYQGSILKNSPESGADSPADRVTAQGDFDLTHGHFIDIPILKDLLAAMHSPSGSTVGEAAATFDISHSVVNLDRTGASSPVLGIQGGGTITFAKQVNMNFVATPLADWAKDVKGAGLLSDVGAAIVGKAQDVVNGLQRAIYQFRVTGDLAKPKVEPVVVPFLSDEMSPLFKKMAGDQSQGSVAAGLKQQHSETGGK